MKRQETTEKTGGREKVRQEGENNMGRKGCREKNVTRRKLNQKEDKLVEKRNKTDQKDKTWNTGTHSPGNRKNQRSQSSNMSKRV